MNAFELLDIAAKYLNPRTFKSYEKILYTSNLTEKKYDKIYDELDLVVSSEMENATKKTIREEMKFINEMMKIRPMNTEWIPFQFDDISELQFNSSVNNVESEQLVDEYNNFYKKRFIFKSSASTSLDDLYQNIQYAIKKKMRVKRKGRKYDLLNVMASILLITPENKNRYITISSDYLYSPKKFIDRINQILSGNVAGSDAIFSGNSDETTIVFNEVILSGTLNIGYNSKKYTPIFKNTLVSDNKTNNKCGEIVMNKIFNHVFKSKIFEKYSKTDLTRFENINKIADELNNVFLKSDISHNICIIANRVKGLQKNEKVEIDGCEYYQIDNVRPVMINTGIKNKPVNIFIIYDIPAKHFDVCFNQLWIRDNIYMGRNGDILEITGGKNIENVYKKLFTMKEYSSGFYTPSNNKSNGKNYDECLRKDYVRGGQSYCFFDFETVIDFKQSNRMVVYSVAYYFADFGLNMENCHYGDYAAELRKCTEHTKPFLTPNFVKVITGFDSLRLFCEDILTLQKNREIVFISYNGSKFDNILLVNEMLRNHEQFQVTNFFYKGNALVNCEINGRSSMFDLKNHLLGSLESNCVSFKCPEEYCKSKLDHFEAQKAYNKGELQNFIETSNLVDYNQRDVLALAYIFFAYSSAIEKLTNENILNYPTASSLAGGINKKNLKEIGYIKKMDKDEDGEQKLKLTYTEFQDLKRSSVGGRCEVFNNTKINEKCVSLDVCSLYPYVMLLLKDFYFPSMYTKKYYTDRDYIKYASDCVGFWYCDINQTKLRERGYPNFFPVKKETNDYKHNEIIYDVLISNFQIDFMRDIGIEVTTKKGFYWCETVTNSKYFENLFPIMKEKNRQDLLKSLKDGDYNAVFREVSKLILNSSFGKNLQTLFPENLTVLPNMYSFLKLSKDKNVKNLGVVDILPNNRILVQYENKEELLISELGNYCVGLMILEASRIHMFRYGFMPICDLDGKDSLIYTDTDAIKIRSSTAEKYFKWIQENNIRVPLNKKTLEMYPKYAKHRIYEPYSKIFGSFEDELAEMNDKAGENAEFTMMCLQPKTWLYSAGEKFKFRMKGVNLKDIFICEDHDLITKNKKGLSVIKQEYTDKELYYYVNTHEELQTQNCAPKLFNELYKNRTVNILCTSFKKVIRNSSRNVGLDDNEKFKNNHHSVEMAINLKRITIK